MSKTKREDNNSYRELCSEKTLQSDPKGFFVSFTSEICRQLGENWLKNTFGKLKSDADRIRCIYEHENCQPLVENFLKNVQQIYRGKDAILSQRKRLESDNCLKEKDHKKALMLICQSVLKAPPTGENVSVDSGLSLAFALWSRSQILIKLNDYSNALVDIQQAIKENLPGSYKAQAYWMMALCYKGVGEENRAKVSFDLAEKLLSNDKEKILSLQEDKKKVVVNNAELSKSTKLSTDNQLCIESKISDKLSIQKSKLLGRYMTANQPISVGETLVTETPYAACLLPDMFGTHCLHCFVRLKSAFGCQSCSSVAFCSIKCRDQANYHKYECKFLDLLIGSGMSVLAHTAFRLITQNGLKKCLEIYKNRCNEKIYSLCTNAEFRTPIDFFQRTLMSVFLLRCLEKTDFFDENINNEILSTQTEMTYQIAEMLLFNLQILQFNAHEIVEIIHTDPCKLKGKKTITIGVGIYLTSSLFNHHCFSALNRHFIGKNIVLTTIRPLAAKEIVPENYGPNFIRKNLIERQKLLTGRYWFKCQCIACTQNWPSTSMGLENVSKRLRCPIKNCSNHLTLPLSKELVHCPKCNNDVNLKSQILRLNGCHEQYKIASEYISNGKISEAARLLCSSIDSFYQISVPPDQSTHLAEEMLGMCLEYLKQSVIELKAED